MERPGSVAGWTTSHTKISGEIEEMRKKDKREITEVIVKHNGENGTSPAFAFNVKKRKVTIARTKLAR